MDQKALQKINDSGPGPKFKSVEGWFNSKISDIEQAIPRNTIDASRLVRVYLTALRKNPKLLKCDAMSLWDSMMFLAETGLQLGGILGEAYLVPFYNSDRKCFEAQVMIGYPGYAELVYRGGAVASMDQRVVWQGETIDVSYGLKPDLVHSPDLNKADEGQYGNADFFYTVIHFKDPNAKSKFIIMNKKQIERRRKMSKSSDSPAWKNHPIAMALKVTTIECCKLVRKSPELNLAMSLDQAAELGRSQSEFLGNKTEDLYLGDAVDTEFEVDESTGEVSEPPEKTQTKSDKLAEKLGAKKEEKEPWSEENAKKMADKVDRLPPQKNLETPPSKSPEDKTEPDKSEKPASEKKEKPKKTKKSEPAKDKAEPVKKEIVYANDDTVKSIKSLLTGKDFTDAMDLKETADAQMENEKITQAQADIMMNKMMGLPNKE